MVDLVGLGSIPWSRLCATHPRIQFGKMLSLYCPLRSKDPNINSLPYDLTHLSIPRVIEEGKNSKAPKWIRTYHNWKRLKSFVRNQTMLELNRSRLFLLRSLGIKCEISYAAPPPCAT